MLSSDILQHLLLINMMILQIIPKYYPFDVIVPHYAFNSAYFTPKTHNAFSLILQPCHEISRRKIFKKC